MITMAQKFQIEMTVPDDVDPSYMLEKAQELALELHEEFPEQDEDGDDIEPDEDAISNDVSVKTLDDKQAAA
jgi:hypothetical protein